MESGPNVLLAIKCRIENKSWAEFIDWRDRPPRRRPTKNGTHPTLNADDTRERWIVST